MTPEEKFREIRRLRAVEKVLMAQYNSAKAEFDQVKGDPGLTHEIVTNCQRYIEAMRRLREFLTDGKTPPDLAHIQGQPVDAETEDE